MRYYTLSFENFITFYEKYGKTPNQAQPPKNPLNEKQLKSAYERYQRSVEKQLQQKEEVEDTKLNEVYNQVDQRDGKCVLTKKIDMYQNSTLKNNAQGFRNILDHAHVFGKGAYPHMKYMEDNIVLLNRYSHSMLDRRKNPITGVSISKEEHEQWWIFIIGKERYNKLKEIANGRS